MNGNKLPEPGTINYEERIEDNLVSEIVSRYLMIIHRICPVGKKQLLSDRAVKEINKLNFN